MSGFGECSLQCGSAPIVIVFWLLLLATTLINSGQTRAAEPIAQQELVDASTTRKLSLTGAVQLALSNYPAIRERNEKQASARSGITLAKTAYLPRVSLFYEEWRASANNSAAISFPNMPIPSVTGPASVGSSFASFWGANTGAWFSWDLVDFGQRRSEVNRAKANNREALAALAVTRLDVAANAADAFLSVVASQQLLWVAQAKLERMQVFATAVNALTKAGLRPGVEASRADAEVALAQDHVIEAQQSVDVARATLAETLGVAGTSVDCESGALLTPPPSVLTELPPPETHPLALHRVAAINYVSARENVLRRSWLPHFSLQSAIYGKGSEDPHNGHFSNTGFLPRIPNWAVALTATFPVSDYFQAHAKETIELHIERAERADLDKTLQVIKGQQSKADAMLKAALGLSNNAPVFLKAAEATELSATARYRVGLGDVVDVAAAESLLAQAQGKYKLADIGVWRALFAQSVAHGDLLPFMRLMASAEARRN
jgi:outer membrane protein